MSTYSVKTYDPQTARYTPQDGVPSEGLTLQELRASLKQLRQMGYSCHYSSVRYWDNDPAVLVEATT